MYVKICGTTTLADARLSIAAGTDALGFIFAPSQRRVTVPQVAEIVKALPSTIETVGVFQTTDVEEIVSTTRETGLSAVQLHLQYSPAMISSLRAQLGSEVKLIQVISCSTESLDTDTLSRDLSKIIADENLWAVLLDAATKTASGGTGANFDWALASAVLSTVWPQRQNGAGPKLLLAGGLRPENVDAAISELRPFGVDAVSGIEASPGTKDPHRLQAFLREAKKVQ